MPSLRSHLRRTLVLLGLACTIGVPSLYACDPSWLPISRTAGLSYFVVIALADTVVELVGGMRGSAHPPSPFDRRIDRVVGRSRGGQRVRLLALGGGDAEHPVAGTPTEAVVIPWAYGPDCAPVAWIGSLAWIPVGTEGLMTGWLRPRERWLDDLPTFDVEMAWREPLWQRDDPRWPRVEPVGKLLNPQEFMALFGALPEWELLERSPVRAADLARWWERDHRDLAVRPPARTILDNLYRSVAERTRGSGRGR